MIKKFPVVFVILMFPFHSLAGTVLDPLVSGFCRENFDCNNPPSIIRDVIAMCRISQESLGCDDFIRKNPELANLAQKCDAKNYCSQNIESLEGNPAACLQGYKSAAIDLGISFKDMAVSLAGFVEQSWENLKTRSQQHRQQLSACQGSFECQKELFYKSVNSSITSYQTELSLPQKAQLAEMSDAAVAAFQKASIRYQCLKPVVQAEMRCYAIGTVFDPTLMAGYGVKLARTVKVVSEVSQTARADSKLGPGVEKLASGGKIDRSGIIDKYLYYSPTTPEQNQKWMNAARTSQSLDQVQFVSFENAEMKSLNTKLLDKNLVTSLTNYHKDIIFNKIEIFKKEFPNLEMESYSDYKSARFAFKGQAPPGFQDRLAQVFIEANQEFSDTLIGNKIIRSTDNSENWIRAGSGKTADQANVASRYSRNQELNKMQNFSDPDLIAQLNSSFKDVEDLRKKIAIDLPKNSSMINKNTLDADAFNIIRKNMGNSNEIQQALKQRFELKEISPKAVTNMQKYVAKIDEFSPDIYVKAREVATLTEASMGGISADMVGMGAQNLRSTAEALAQAKNTDEALGLARKMEVKVSQEFTDQKNGFQKVVSSQIGSDRIKNICSGDDCVSVPLVPLTQSDKAKILQGLADKGYTSKFRLSFIPEGIKDSATRSPLGTHGESIEVKLQSNLASQIEPAKLKALIFGVDMQTKNLNKGPIKLLMGVRKDVLLTSSEKEKIEKSFQLAVQQMNDELRTQGIKAQYQAQP